MGKIHRCDFDYNGVSVKNLYRFLLQREPDEIGYNAYHNSLFVDNLNEFLNSHEYSELTLSKIEKNNFDEKINYVVMKVDNRADETIQELHNLLPENFKYNEIEFFNYKKSDIEQFYSNRNIKMNWMADVFGLNKDGKIGEFACVASHIVALEYLVNSDLDELIVFEDDIILDSDFVRLFGLCYNDLPKNYDALADSTFLPNYQEFSTVEENILIDSKYICKAHLQNSHTGFILYSKTGAKKILEFFKTTGVLSAIDTYLFWLNRRGSLDIYTTFYTNKLVKEKDIYGSIGKD